jgi:hypothetical protein
MARFHLHYENKRIASRDQLSSAISAQLIGAGAASKKVLAP